MNSDFKNFPNNVFETAEFCCIVGLIVILRLLQRENSTFPQPVVFIVFFIVVFRVEPWKLLSNLQSKG